MASHRVLRGNTLKSNNTNKAPLQISTTTLPSSHHGIHLPTQIPQGRKAISERTRNIIQTQNDVLLNKMGKRKADLSPINNEKITKRYALGNLTNNATLLNNNNNNNINNNNKTIKNNNDDDIKSNITNIKHCDKLLKKTANTTSKTASLILHNNNNNNNNKNNIIIQPTVTTTTTTSNINVIPTKPTKKSTKNLKKENCVHPPQDVKLNAFNSALPPSTNNNNNNNNNNNSNIDVKPTKILTRAAARATKLKEEIHDTVVKPKDNNCIDSTVNNQKPPATRRISNEFEKTEDSLYISALADVSSDSFLGRPTRNSLKSLNSLSGNVKLQQQQQPTVSSHGKIKFRDEHKRFSNASSNNSAITLLTTLDNSSLQSTTSELNEFKTPSNHLQMDDDILIESKTIIPEDIEDFDRENWKDPHQVSNYAMDIFLYLRKREPLFPINDYMSKQINLSTWMRTLLIDWMVEVQETFELNHETLYLGVKLVDLYLDKVVIAKDKLQLLGAATLFIACKFDERIPPLVTDFMYICDGAYTRLEITKMEADVLRHTGYDLGIPISYRFLRRYSRCAKIPVHKLTLARYILEYSLMDYDTIFFSDSKMACAALYMALRMHNQTNVWDKTLEYYTDYKLDEFKHVIATLNAGLHQPCRPNIKTVHSKYSHPVFHEVTRVPLMTTETLLELS